MQFRWITGAQCAPFLAALLLAFSGAIRPTSAQGHAVLLVDNIRHEVRLAPRKAGSTTSFGASLASAGTFTCMAAGAGDETAFAVFGANWRTQRINALTVLGDGVMRTIARYPNNTFQSELFVDMDMDDAGELRFLWRGYDRSRGYFGGVMTAPVGAPALSTLFNWPPGLAPTSFVEDPATGDWLITNNGYLLRATTTGVATTLAKLTTTTGHMSDIAFDPVTGEVLIGFQGMVVRVTPSGKVTSYGVPLPQINDISFDRATRGFLLCGTKSGMSTFEGFWALVDASGVVVFSAKDPPGSGFLGVETGFGRDFTPRSAPERGKPYRIDFRSPLEATKDYRCALSLACTPGIPTTVGMLPLVADNLFFLSLLDPPFLQGFAGTLDANGAAILTLTTPDIAALKDARIHLAGVVFDATGLRSIHGPLSFTIR